MLTPKEQRMVANAIRQVVVMAEGGSYKHANALSNEDTLADFINLHIKVSAND